MKSVGIKWRGAFRMRVPGVGPLAAPRTERASASGERSRCADLLFRPSAVRRERAALSFITFVILQRL